MQTAKEIAITDLTDLRDGILQLLAGKESAVDGLLAAILSRGHILVEDVPGVGKTTLVKGLARLLGLELKRIQCTNDLLPSDILGVQVFHAEKGGFEFHPGPIFSPLVLADELNRTSPRTQSALLQALGEGSVTVDRVSYSLPEPFIVFATQNPSDHVGTYPLPESQLDRFAVRIHLDYPVPEKEKEILTLSALDPVGALPQGVVSPKRLLALQTQCEGIHLSDKVVEYAQKVVGATRSHPALERGVSTRGAVTWMRVSRGRALLAGRDFVIPDDLMEMILPTLSHRIVPHSGNDPREVLENLLNEIEVP